MRIVSIGKVTVTAAGTPVQLIQSPPPNGACRIIIEPLVGNSGKAYIGLVNMSVSTGAAIIKTFLPPATSGINDSWEIDTDGEGNSLDVSTFYGDVQTSSQGFNVSYACR